MSEEELYCDICGDPQKNKHMQKLKSIPTYNINMDSIYRLQDIRFLESEINGTVLLDLKIREKCSNISKSLGYEISSIKMPFGGGATDAAEFAKAKFPSLSIIGLDTTFSSGDVPYHTHFDTVDKIEPEAVLACMQISEQFILSIDFLHFLHFFIFSLFNIYHFVYHDYFYDQENLNHLNDLYLSNLKYIY